MRKYKKFIKKTFQIKRYLAVVTLLAKLPPLVAYLTSNVFTRFDHSTLGKLKPK